LNGTDQTLREASQFETPGLGRRLLHWISALVLLALMASGAYALMLWEPHELPVRVVTVDGEVNRLSPLRLQETVVGHLSGGILSQDLVEIKAAVEEMPWIRSASLRRHWPDRLELAVEEHVALARWGSDGLVTADGVVFRPDASDISDALTLLAGLDEHAPKVVERYLAWKPRLEALKLGIEELSMDPRGAWTLRTSAGFTLALGKSRVEERMSRFVRAYPRLAAVGVPAVVDTRYSNGLAIRWLETEGDGQGLGAGETARAAQLKPRPSRPSRS
jgi:cell division protein FtsQ